MLNRTGKFQHVSIIPKSQHVLLLFAQTGMRASHSGTRRCRGALQWPVLTFWCVQETDPYSDPCRSAVRLMFMHPPFSWAQGDIINLKPLNLNLGLIFHVLLKNLRMSRKKFSQVILEWLSVGWRAEEQSVENKENQLYLTPQLIKIKCQTGQEKVMW